jgi:hypothetical protein
MSVRQVSEPTVNERGFEEHPAFGRIRAGRSSNTPGSVLFDSDLKHQHSIVIQVSTATRKRDLNRDWVHTDKQILEVEMSEAQWASLVSSVGSTGTSCTIRYREGGDLVDGLPYAPRMAQSMREVDEAAEEVFGKIQEAMAAYEEHKTAANLRTLRSAVDNAGANLGFVANSMARHAEGVVQRAKADIEAMVINKAQQIGAPDPDLVKGLLEITEGES